MEWESIEPIIKWLEENGGLVQTLAVIFGVIIILLGWFNGVFAKIWHWFRPKKQVEIISTDTILEKLLSERTARNEAEQEIDALRKTIEALQNQQGSKRDAALDALAQGKTGKAEELFTALAREREKSGTTAHHQAAQAWRHLGTLAFLHNTKKALTAYQKATLLDPDNPDGWNQLGHLQKRLGNLAAAINAYNKVLSLGNQISNKSLIVTATGNLGNVHKTRGDLDKAEEMYNRALKISRELGAKEAMANAYGNLGIVHQARGDLDKAEEMHNRSLEIDRVLGAKEGMACDYGNLGNVHKTRGDLNKAEEMYNRALEIDRVLGAKEGMACDYGNLGNVHQIRGDLDKAEEMYNRALEINRKLDRKEGMAHQYGNLGIVHQIRDDLDKACKCWQQSRDLFAQLGAAHMVEQVDRWMRDAGCG